MIDYTSRANVLAYGDERATLTAAEQLLLDTLITATSRTIDHYCGQRFSQEIYVNQRLTGSVDGDGLLVCFPPTPTMTAPTAAAWKTGSWLSWSDLDLITSGMVEVETAACGCAVRFLGTAPRITPYAQIQVRLSYTGGWANLAAVPADFEWAARRLAWWEYKKRSAPMERSAIPELGLLIVPQAWPPDLRQRLQPYMYVGA